MKSAAGPLFFAVLAFLSAGASYAMWPPDFFGNSFSGMSGGMLIRAVASTILVFGAFEFLCSLAIVTRSDS